MWGASLPSRGEKRGSVAPCPLLAGAFVCLTLIIVSFGGTAGIAQGSTSGVKKNSSPIVLPNKGQKLTSHRVKIIVRAGPEHGDLSARLNGRQIGEDFARSKHGIRALRISSSHGLRHGRNVLRVETRNGIHVRRGKVVFRVVTKRPLAGAGRDRVGATGKVIHVRGRIVQSPHGPRARGVRWKVIRAPGARRGRAVAISKAASLKLLGARRTISPVIRPTRSGTYTLRMTSGRGKFSASDTVTVDVGPRSAAIEVDTAVTGDDPAGTVSDSPPQGRAGIRVGDTVYRAPWLQAAQGKTFSGISGRTTYEAVWQVVALDRTHLSLVWNRTYGRCTDTGAGGLRDFSCRINDQGIPVGVNMAREISDVGSERLVIATSHAGSGSPADGRAWAMPDTPDAGPVPLVQAGLPADPPSPKPDYLAGVVPGGITLIGTPGIPPGDAKLSRMAGGGARMQGFLISDINNNYGFVPSARPTFDTRSETTCDNASPMKCLTAMMIGGSRSSVESSGSGFLVAVYDDHTLTRLDAQVFGVGSGATDAEGLAEVLASYLEERTVPGILVAITSYGSPSALAGRSIRKETGVRLANAIASIGGTKDRFNTAATRNTSYTLLGWVGAGEGNGAEVMGSDARLRGVLSPNDRSRFRPANYSAIGSPAEHLQQLLIAPRTKAWPLDDQPGPRAAIAWIGNQIPQLGGDPRHAYWQQTLAGIGTAMGRFKYLAAPTGEGFSESDFSAAKKQLYQELEWVKSTREYFQLMAEPADKSGKVVWENATILQNRLEAEVKFDKKNAQAKADWFGVVQSLLSMAGGVGALVEAEKEFVALVGVTASALVAGDLSWQARHNGAQPFANDPRVKADDLALKLEEQSRRTTESLWRMGNAVISDPKKLEEVGYWAQCLPDAQSGGCDAEHEEYAVGPADNAKASHAASASLNRILYSQLVPLSFPIWDTGLSREPDPEKNFNCLGGSSFSSPFRGAPPLAISRSFDEVGTPYPDEPDADKGANRWRTSIMVRRDETTYSWPSQTILDRMFGPIDPDSGPIDLDSESGGLGLSPVDLMRDSESRFEPGATCWWSQPGSAVIEPQP